MDVRARQIASRWDGPLPSDRLRVGGCQVDVQRRTVVHADGSVQRLTVKSLHVLLTLAESPGQVCSREALLSRVWPTTLPSDEVLTQAVAQLRRAFQDDRDEPQYIETLARLGYRLLAPVEWLAEVPPPAAPTAGGQRNGDGQQAAREQPEGGEPQLEQAAPAVHPLPLESAAGKAVGLRGRLERQWRVAAAILAVLALSGLAVWLALSSLTTARSGELSQELEVRAIFPSTAQERWPSLSPDGTQVAFSQQLEGSRRHVIRVGRTGSSTARQFSHPQEGQDDQYPVWSPDGRKIAFLRLVDSGCQVMVAAVDEDDARLMGSCTRTDQEGLAWLPDGSGVVMAGRVDGEEGTRLRLLRFSDGQWQDLDYDRPEGAMDALPRFSSDGQWLGFRRGRSFADLWIMPASGGKPRQITERRGDIRGWDWMPDGRSVVYVWIRDGSTIHLHDIATGSTRLLRGVGPRDPLHPDVAANAPVMVMELDHSRLEMKRVQLGSGGERGRIETVFPSTGVDILPNPSPDGRIVAFGSDRSLVTQLWLGEPDHPATLHPVDGIAPVPRHTSSWSADGRKLLVLSMEENGDALYEVDVASGQKTRLDIPAEGLTFGLYVDRDDRVLVGQSAGEGRTHLVLYERGTWRRLAQIQDVSIARFDPVHKRVCFTRVVMPGLWCGSPALEQVYRVPDTEAHFEPDARNWTLAGGRIVYLARDAGCATRLHVLGEDPSGAVCVDALTKATRAGLAADAKGQWVYLTLPGAAMTDVGWMSLASIAGK